MGDLKTPFTDAIYPNTSDLSGEGTTSRGTDPNAEGNDGPAGIQPIWDTAPVKRTDISETPNSVSKLPALPNRVEPSAPDHVEPANLRDRSPLNVDKS